MLLLLVREVMRVRSKEALRMPMAGLPESRGLLLLLSSVSRRGEGAGGRDGEVG